MKVIDADKQRKQDSELKILVAFDIETRQDEGVHIPNLLIAHIVCDKCTQEKEDCEVCGQLERIYEGEDCVANFTDFICEELAKKEAQIYVFAHNFRGYDGKFIFRYLWTKKYKGLEVVLSGNKILRIQLSNIKFIDSLNFFQQKLSELPKSFGFKAAKGHFPHFFNTAENWAYVGKYPPLDFYGVKMLKPADAKELIQWYDEVKDNVFNFREEIIKYCRIDVEILLKAVLAFRKQFKEIAGFDPITRAFTLASLSLEYFRARCLPEKTLGITPSANYFSRMQSKVANVWLDWLQFNQKIGIDREQKIGIYFADGICWKTKTLYEFWGCIFHGCPCKYYDEEKYSKTKEKVDFYRSLGYKVVQIWEHEFHEQKNENHEMKHYCNERQKYYNEIDQVGHLKLRDAFFGGRTNNLRFYHECKEDEKLNYYDVCSLYPYVMKSKRYPLGHPQLITENFDYSLHSYFGFVRCRVEAPDNLRLPVLPSRINGKLMFVLCEKCAIGKEIICIHEDRSFVGTLSTAELNKAIEKGYIVKQIYEVLHYEKSSDTLFKKYIEAWQKVKVEASGWPSNVELEEQKIAYIQRYKEKEGITLENIENNPGRRKIAKLLLNSLYGKMGQRLNLPQTKIINSYAELWELASNPKYKFLGEIEVDNDTTVVSYELTDPEEAEPGNTNVSVAAFVTSYARLHLYEYLDKVESVREGRLLYFDTDSLFFVHKEGDPEIETGEFLGELTDKILGATKDPEAKCLHAIFCGPKNYAYEVTLPNGDIETEIKVKGITLTNEVKEIITFDSMKKIAKNYCERDVQDILLVPQQNIVSQRMTHILTSRVFDKQFRAVSDKRIVIGNNTVPYGFTID